MSAPVIDQIYGGQFQDPNGNPLSGGKILFQLSQLARVIGGDEQVTPGHVISYTLDSNGNVPASNITFITGFTISAGPVVTFNAVNNYSTSQVVTVSGITILGGMNQNYTVTSATGTTFTAVSPSSSLGTYVQSPSGLAVSPRFGTVSTLWGNDQLTPSGTYYIVKLYNSNGQLSAGPVNWQILGGSPIDLGTIISAGGGGTFLSGVVLTNPGFNQEVVTGNLKIDNGLDVVGAYTDSTGSVGTSGQVLSSTVTGTLWESPGALSGVVLLNPGSNQEILTGDLKLDHNLSVVGAIKDSTGTVGTSGQILSSTVTGTLWENDIDTTITVNGGSALTPPVNIQNGTGTTVTNPSGSNVQVNISSPLPSSAQIGDIPRYNVNGDALWDAVNYSQKQAYVFYQVGNGTFTGGFGYSPGSATTLGSSSNTNPTTTDNPGSIYAAAATASTNTVIGTSAIGAANNGTFGFQAFYRWTHRWAAGETTNVRYWMGLTYYLNGVTSLPLGTGAFATDTPNQAIVGFRYSSGTDTTWKAVVGTNSSNITVTNTSVSVDTNPHFFEVAWTGSSYIFFIDHASVATISTNLPSATLLGTGQFWCGDNKNTNNAVGATFYYMSESLK